MAFVNKKRRNAIGGWILLAFTISTLAFVKPSLYGLEDPEPVGPYFNNTFPAGPPGDTDWQVENAFPNLTFVDPVQIIEVPNQNKFIVAGKKGSIWTFDNDPTTKNKNLFLNIEAQVWTAGDAGLLGMVLHPEFGQAGSPNRGYVYVFYRYLPPQGRSGRLGYVRLSRFTVPDGSLVADRDSEYILIQQYDRHDWHNGGGMFFGTDGFLYLTSGDEGGAHDQFRSGQKITTGLFGGILRLDVDMDPTRSHPIRRQPLAPATPPAGWPETFSQGYYIPNDNPWVDSNGSVLEEFYAIGLRSPHRMTFDEVTGDIWIGDVGQGSREEISIAHKGDNMQWPYKEGNVNGRFTKPDALIGIDTPPVFDYGRNQGTCVIGGFVYRGDKWPSLKGKYIFGDHTSRRVWTLNYPGPSPVTSNFMLQVPAEGVGSKAGISSFGTDSKGNIYILKLFGTNRDGGKVLKLTKKSANFNNPPQLLSETGIFTNLSTLAVAKGIIPYTVNSPLWSDRAEKKRWISVPNDGSHNTAAEQITFSPDEDWKFPVGTVFIKHFELPVDKRDPAKTQRLETRVMVVGADKKTYGFTYKWNAEGTDATLLETGASETYTVIDEKGKSDTQTWDFPSRLDCKTCHNDNAGQSLGVKTHQLNGELKYASSGITDNQLRVWNKLGMFSTELDENQIPFYHKSVDIQHSTADDETKVRSYLDANCAHCHRPGGVTAGFDARLSTPLQFQNLINAATVSNASPDNGVIVTPGKKKKSELWVRDQSTGSDAMPPLGRNLVDEEYIDVLTAWINGIEEDHTEEGLEKNLVAYWSFDQGSLQDVAGDINDKGTLVGGVELNKEGKQGQAIRISSPQSYITVPHSEELNMGVAYQDFTLSFWMKLEKHIGPWMPLMNKQGSGVRTPGIWVNHSTGGIHYRISTDTNWNHGGDTGTDFRKEPNLNTWAHITYVKKGNTLRLYVNGKLDQAERTFTGNLRQNTAPFMIGNNYGNDRGTVWIDEVKIFNKGLTEAEVEEVAGVKEEKPCAEGYIVQETWKNLDGEFDLASIPVSKLADEKTELSTFAIAANQDDNYGVRIRGYICPPTDGEYIFKIASDDAGALWLSSDADPANKRRIARVRGWTNEGEYDKYNSQTSSKISLKAGERYYIEAQMKEVGGGDNLSVAWVLPDGTFEAPIAGSVLSPFDPADEPPVEDPEDPGDEPEDPPVVGACGDGEIKQEIWLNLNDSYDLASVPVQQTPQQILTLNKFEIAADENDFYGTRVRGLICAPATGNYQFLFASDDNGALYLSTDDSPLNKRIIASVPGWTLPGDYTKFGEQKSAKIRLEAGKKYYIEGLMKEVGGGDHMSVAWILPDGKTEAPIKGDHLSIYTGTSAATQGTFTPLSEPLEDALTLSFQLYPNPASTHFFVSEKANGVDEVNIRMTTLTGKLVLDRRDWPINRSVEIADMSRGIYLVEVQVGSHRQVFKIMKN